MTRNAMIITSTGVARPSAEAVAMSMTVNTPADSVRPACLRTPIGRLLVLWLVHVLVGATALAQTRVENDKHVRERIDSARPLIQSVYAYREMHGLWPVDLADLVREHLPAVPRDDWKYTWRPDGGCSLMCTLSIEPPDSIERRIRLAYAFGAEEDGWYSDIHGGFVLLDAGPPVPPRPRLPRGELIERVVAEYDRRIGRDPRNSIHHVAKCSWLFNTDEMDRARVAAHEWIKAMPDDPKARYALVSIEKKRRSGQGIFETSSEWAKRPHPNLGIWRIFNSPLTNTGQRDGREHPFKRPLGSNQEELYLAELTLLEAAHDRYGTKRFHATIEMCDQWEALAQRRGELADTSFLALRAAARLRLGEFDRALTDAVAAAEQQRLGRLLSGGADELLEAAKSRQRDYDYGSAVSDRLDYTWLIKAE
jgi:hypothetical protein